MSANQHIEWLNLVEKTGPFLAVGVLDEAFPQGLEKVETRRRQRVRSAYDEWRDAVDAGDSQLVELHREWVKLVLEELLDYDSSVLKARDALPAALTYREASCGVEVRPDIVAMAGDRPRLIVTVFAPDTDLNAPLAGDAWAASPIERTIQLCRATDVQLALVTDGESWSVVCVPADGGSSVATWFARIWQQEPVTLQAFVSLLGVRRCFGPAEGTLEALLERCAANQNEITDTLGEQVRRAVEVLVQALDKADAARNRQLLHGVTEVQLYEAGLTVMMRLVVVLCAEQRGLLLLGADIYDQHYAITTLRARLVKEQTDLTDEVQERRHDAWSRILAVCRGVFGGIEHASLRLPPLGGSLFDPDRFPFLEGRPAGTTWRTTPAVPLPIDNRTVLTLLTALQVLEQAAGAQFLSYEALDVEQVGHVYEGLLERTVKRVPEVTLGLIGSAKAYNPNVSLRELEEKSIEGREPLLSFLQEETGRSASALRKALTKPADEALRRRIAMACGLETELAPRLMPFAGLIREDSAKRLLMYGTGSFIVTLGDSRRATGAHYTPKSLTEPIVQHTLEPLVYLGPAEGKPQDEWRLKSPSDLLALKICDMAMGSAAFLVQTCRWLADRLIEAWDVAEQGGRSISMEGSVLERPGNTELLPRDKAERVLIARRLVASRCIYGVDKSPMAVELAKVSLWLVTMMKSRPFSFLDHALKCGDSLLGASSLEQIGKFSLRPGERQVTFATSNLFRFVEAASAKRRALEELPSTDYSQIETKNRLHAEAEAATIKVKALADMLTALELSGLDGDAYEEQRAIEAERAQLLMKRDADASHTSQPKGLNLQSHACEQLLGSRPFQWPVEFPEVFELGGFDAFVGNPPFLGGTRISTVNGEPYLRYLKTTNDGCGNRTDLIAYFFRRVFHLLKQSGTWGLISTNTIAETDTSDASLGYTTKGGAVLYRADKDYVWPGTAGVIVSVTHAIRGHWRGDVILDGAKTSSISPSLTPAVGLFEPRTLSQPFPAGYGAKPNAEGFLLSDDEARRLLDTEPSLAAVIRLYVAGDDIATKPTTMPDRWVIYFGDISLEDARKFDLPFKIVEQRVRPERAIATDRVKREKWWQFERHAKEVFEAAKSLDSCWVAPETSKHHLIARFPTSCVVSNGCILFADQQWATFGILQSQIHEVWARRPGMSKLKTDPRYNAAKCFHTFPLCSPSIELQGAAQKYYDHRTAVLLIYQEGLTKIYNRFHKHGEQSAEIERLRTLHVEMDRTVAAAYGWNDLDLAHGFYATKQGERYTISESARRIVLDRLLVLNHQRYDEQVKAGLHDKKAGKKKRATPRSRELNASPDQIQEELL